MKNFNIQIIELCLWQTVEDDITHTCAVYHNERYSASTNVATNAMKCRTHAKLQLVLTGEANLS